MKENVKSLMRDYIDCMIEEVAPAYDLSELEMKQINEYINWEYLGEIYSLSKRYIVSSIEDFSEDKEQILFSMESGKYIIKNSLQENEKDFLIYKIEKVI